MLYGLMLIIGYPSLITVFPLWFVVCFVYIKKQQSEAQFYHTGFIGSGLGVIAGIVLGANENWGSVLYFAFMFLFMGFEVAIAYALCFRPPRERIVGAAIGTCVLSFALIFLSVLSGDFILGKYFIDNIELAILIC